MKLVNLALQGGGSHGAFTWGVLDALLEDGRLDFDGISGTSAGAMNAVALAHGFATAGKKADPREAARASLARLWDEIVKLGAASTLQRNMLDVFLGGWRFNEVAQQAASQFSPYQTNPLDINPLRSLLGQLFDFDRIAVLGGPKVFVSATHVVTGKAEIFSGKRLNAASVMASACLPMLFQAIEIGGESYWDGGYAGNPAIHPLIYRCHSADIILVQINPLERNSVPNTAPEIMDRINELTFNASLLSQMRAVDFVNRMLRAGSLPKSRYREVLLHRVDGGEALEAYPASSKATADGGLIQSLCELGRTCGKHWLGRHFAQVGEKSTVNIARDYLDDMRIGSLGD